MTVERAAPAYRQLATRLREDIEAGRLKPGERLPTQRDLAWAYHVAKSTAHQAVIWLRDHGYVEARPGGPTTGYAVADPATWGLARVPEIMAAQADAWDRCVAWFAHALQARVNINELNAAEDANPWREDT